MSTNAQPGDVRLVRLRTPDALPMVAVHDPDPERPTWPWRLTGRGRAADALFTDPNVTWFPLVPTSVPQRIVAGAVLRRETFPSGSASVAIYAPDEAGTQHREANSGDGPPAHWCASTRDDADGTTQRWLTHYDVEGWTSLVPDPDSVVVRAEEEVSSAAPSDPMAALSAVGRLNGIEIALRAGGRLVEDGTPLDVQVADLVADANASSDAAHDAEQRLRASARLREDQQAVVDTLRAAHVRIAGMIRALDHKGYGPVYGDPVAWLEKNLPPSPDGVDTSQLRCGYAWTSRTFGRVTGRWRCPLPLGHEPLEQENGDPHGSEAFPIGEYVETLVAVLRTVATDRVFADYWVAVEVLPDAAGTLVDPPEGDELPGYCSAVLTDATVAGSGTSPTGRLVRRTEDRRVVTTPQWQTMDADSDKARTLTRLELTDAGRAFLDAYALMVSA